MTTGTNAAPEVPDPDGVYELHELRAELQRLRRRGAAPTPGAAVSFTELARRTGLPRSTVHSYVVGPAVPDASALDRIVLALGCTGDEARRWAQAWERVSDADRGGQHPNRAAGATDLQRFVRAVEAQLSAPGEAVTEPVVRPVSIAERCVVGSDGLIDVLDVRVSARAVLDGADRWYMRLPVGDSSPHPDLIRASSLHQCEVGASRFVAEPGFQAIEILLGGSMARGQLHTFEFRIDLIGARERAQEEGREVATRRATSASRAFPKEGPRYELEVSFFGQLPSAVHQIYQSGPTALPERGQVLEPNHWRSVSLSVERPSPGLHGIGWVW